MTFNDKPVTGLKSLVCMVDSCDEEFLKFSLENHNVSPSPFLFLVSVQVLIFLSL